MGRSTACRSPTRTSSSGRAGPRPAARPSPSTSAAEHDATVRRPAGGGRRDHARPPEPLGAGAGAVRRQRPPRGRRDALAPGHCAGGSSSGSGRGRGRAASRTGPSGTDTGGSIRLPAACCGVVGLKPTYGRVSRAGAMPLSWSLDHVGPLARTVRDAAILLGVIAGADGRDATASARPVPDYVAGLDRPIAGLRIGGAGPLLLGGPRRRGRWPPPARRSRGSAGSGRRWPTAPLPDPALLNDLANVIARCESAAVHARIARESPHALQPAVRGAPRRSGST